jgi:hypothetical protein
MSIFAAGQSPPATLSGTYVVTFNCFATSTSLSPDGAGFTGAITFQGSGSASTNTYTNTATTLTASPSDFARLGHNVTFTATVNPPNAAGQVQFMDGTTNLGAPVTVSGGQAVYETSALAVGSHSLTATFGPLPSDTSGSWGLSTSAVLPYVMTGTGTGTDTDYVTPGAGNPATTLTVTTNGTCPSGDTNFDVTVSGTGSTTNPVIAPDAKLPIASSGGYSVALSETMATFAAGQSPPATLSGVYTFTFNCLATSTSLRPDASFVGTLTFQGSGNGSTNTYTNTATTLAASPSGSAASGSDVTFTATVSPSNAAGQVQFMDGKTDLGAPVTVSDGQAVYSTLVLAAGSHSLAATFGPLPSDTSDTWGSSTSAVLPYVMTGTGTATGTGTDTHPVFVPTVWGSVKVGSTVDCIQAVAHATSTSWSWYENGHKIAGATGWQYEIPSSLKGDSLECELSATNHAGTTAETSAETSAAVKAHATAILSYTTAASGTGTADITPGTGNPDTALTLNTNGFCPAGNTNADVTVSGTGVTTHPIIAPNSPLPTAGPTGYSLQLSETMATFASEESPPATLSGAYVFSFNCLATSLSLSPDASFTGTITFQGSGNGSTNTYTVTGTGTGARPVFVPTAWGTVKVGSTVHCVQAVDYATSTSWSWYENGGKIAGATQSQYKIPSSLKGESLACELSAKSRAGTTAETSATVTVNAA